MSSVAEGLMILTPDRSSPRLAARNWCPRQTIQKVPPTPSPLFFKLKKTQQILADYNSYVKKCENSS